MDAVVDVTWRMVGRRNEIRLIDEVLAGAGVGLAFAGAAGVGKTRLLRTAMERAVARGWVVELVAATRAGASVPFAAASHLLPTEPVLRDPAVLFRRAAERLGDRLVLLAVDDAHLLDQGSAALVHYLCTHRRALAVVTVRNREQTPDAITALWKDGLVHRVEVPPLSDSDLDELLGHVLDGHLPMMVRLTLRQLAAGNPLYLRALVSDGLESGTLRYADGRWHWHGAVSEAGRLHDLVEARLSGCDPDARSVVEMVACGEPLPLALVESDAGLVAAEQAGLLEVTNDGQRAMVRLAHPIYGEALRTMLRPIRRREIYRTLAERLGRTPLKRRDDRLWIATWQMASGSPPSASVLLPAAAQAMARYDLALAERLARAAVDAGVRHAKLFLADVLHWRGQHDDGMALLAAEPTGDADPAERIIWRTTKAQILYWGLARHEEARTMLAASTGDHGVDGTRPMILLSEGQCQEALAAARAVLTNDSASVDSRLWAYVVAVTVTAALGLTGTALRLADEGDLLTQARPGEIRIAGPYLSMARAYALMFDGRLAEARNVVDRGNDEAARTGDHGLIAAWVGLRGVIAQVQGDLDVAVASLREAVTIEERHDPSGNLRLRLTVLAGALAMSGAVDEAQRVLLRADALPSPVQRLFQAQAETNRAWVAAAGGDLTRAAAIAVGGADIARKADLRCLEAIVLHDAARHGAAERVRGRLEELAGSVEGELVVAFARSAAALAIADGPALAAVGETFAALDAPLLAAEAMLAASKVFRAAGAGKQARIAREKARDYTDRCPAARTSGLMTDFVAVPLTSREREIAKLAAQSISSPEIASRLRLSVRTVNNHLARVYQKLGISRRVELGELFAHD